MLCLPKEGRIPDTYFSVSVQHPQHCTPVHAAHSYALLPIAGGRQHPAWCQQSMCWQLMSWGNFVLCYFCKAPEHVWAVCTAAGTACRARAGQKGNGVLQQCSTAAPMSQGSLCVPKAQCAPQQQPKPSPCHSRCPAWLLQACPDCCSLSLPGISSQAAELPLVHITQCSALQLAAGRQTGRQTRWTDGWTYRQTDTQADRQADRQTGRWINRQDATGLNTCSWAGRGGHRNTCSELTSCYLLKNFARIDNQLWLIRTHPLCTTLLNETKKKTCQLYPSFNRRMQGPNRKWVPTPWEEVWACNRGLEQAAAVRRNQRISYTWSVWAVLPVAGQESAPSTMPSTLNTRASPSQALPCTWAPSCMGTQLGSQAPMQT